MHWLNVTLDHLAGQPVVGYHSNYAAATEPTALAALALIGHERHEAAVPALTWLADAQRDDGSLGVNGADSEPAWTTSLAALAWMANESEPERVERAVQWLLSQHGRTFPQPRLIGHDTTIDAWSWVAKTHAWIEPTAMHVLALKAAGHADHRRVRDAIGMIQDRLLPAGGCNYGNTFVLGQELRPHLMPSGLALLALTGEAMDQRLERTLQYAGQQVRRPATTISLSYGLLGLAAHEESCAEADTLLKAALQRSALSGTSAFKLALAALAALGECSPLVILPRNVTIS